MRLPKPEAAFSRRVRFGRYVARRLRRAKRAELAAAAREAALAVKVAGRAWEDAEEDIQDALADREGGDDDCDVAAQTIRNALEGRGLDALYSEPYILIFDRPIDYYISAPLAEQVPRYRDLIERCERHLPEGDPLRAQIEVMKTGLADFIAASEAMAAAERAFAVAAQNRDRAERDFDRLMDKIYSALRGELGAKAADKFFPKARK